MSCLVWLPLNGDLRNQGIIGSTVTTSGKYSFTTGKLGQCITSSSSGYCQVAMGGKVAELTASNQFSIGAWIKTTGTSAYLINIGNADNTSTGNTRGLWLSNNGYTQWAFTGSGVPNTAIPINDGVWRHIFCTVDGSTVKTYINGVLHSTITATITDQVTGHEYASVHPTNTTFINDFRIYDTCLSPKEVSEIAKGIICHYPLNDIACTASINKYSGDTAEGKTTAASGATVTKLANERGYNYKYSYTGTGTNEWAAFAFPHFSFTAGKTYDYSCKIRCNTCSSNMIVEMRAARMDNDWERPKSVTVISHSLSGTGWKEYHLQVPLSATSDRSGTTYNTNPLLEFYTGTMHNKDEVYTFDADIKDVQISECDSSAPFMTGSFVDTTVYDTSGFGNHGSMSSAKPTYSTDSPRYDGCHHFGNLQYIQAPSPWGKSVALEQFTIALWIKQDSSNNGNYSTFFNSLGYGQSGLWLGMNVENSGLWGFRGGVSPNYARSGDGVLTTDTWYHVAYVFNQGYVTWYLNGVKKATTKYDGTSIAIGSIFEIGNSRGDVTWNTHFAGSISDFRWYATVLSDTAIKQLYNSPISVTNTGTLMTQGEFKEE